MPDEDKLAQGSRFTGLMKKLLLNPATQALIAGAPAVLGTIPNPALQASGAAISVFGTFMVAQYSQLEANNERLAEQVDAKMERLFDQGRFNERIFEDPDFKGLVFQAAVAAAQETSKEKIDLIAAILAAVASKDRPSDLNMRAILASITFLTIDEVRLARQFYDGFDRAKWAIVDGIRTPNWGENTDFYLSRLETANLIYRREVQGLPPRFQGERGNYFVTPMFRRLMELIKQTERNPPT